MARFWGGQLYDLIKQQISYQASYLIALGRSIANVIRALALYYPTATPEQIQEGVYLGAEAENAGGIAGFRFNRRVGDQQIPVNPMITSQYRYVAVYRCVDAATGETTEATVVWNTNNSLSFEALGQEIAPSIKQAILQQVRSGTLPEGTTDCKLFQIQSIERRS